jgi:ArsR family transcriptional regulator
MVSNSKQQEATVGNDPLSAETVEMVAAILKVVGDPVRIRLIEILNDRGSATVSALTACVPVSQPTVSNHLAVLHNAGIVSRRPAGMWVYYELVDFAAWWLICQLANGLDEGPDSSSS